VEETDVLRELGETELEEKLVREVSEVSPKGNDSVEVFEYRVEGRPWRIILLRERTCE